MLTVSVWIILDLSSSWEHPKVTAYSVAYI
jgi:hypothetical protein